MEVQQRFFEFEKKAHDLYGQGWTKAFDLESIQVQGSLPWDYKEKIKDGIRKIGK
jgi:hypothetical protein